MNTIKFQWNFVVIAAVTMAAVVVTLSFTPMLRATNCRGISAALNTVSSLCNFAHSMSMERPDGVFNFSSLSDSETRNLAELLSSGWNRSVKFYVAFGDISFSERTRRVIAVCSKSYRNVPERWVGSWRWPAPPTHAAAFSDGTTALISPAEYASINPSDLIDVASLVSPKAISE